MLKLLVVRKFILVLFLFGLLVVGVNQFNVGFRSVVLADEVDDCIKNHPNDQDKCIALISEKITQLQNAINPLQKESAGLQSKIIAAKGTIANMEKQIITLGERLVDKESDLEVQKTLLSERVRQYYINSRKYNPLLIFFSSHESTTLLRSYSLYQAVINQDKATISTYSGEISRLNQNKTNLESEKTKLSALKKSFESRVGFLSNEIQKAETYKAELSKRQQSLIAEKNALFSTSVGDVSSSDDPASRSDYNPGFSPAFAVFSFGAPHRNGMSQYGAFGRAKAGQNYEAIIKAYYGDVRIEKIETNGNIKTDVGTIPFEDNYLVGIAEMPAKWGDEGGYEALKAQAIAARTYALSRTENLNKQICVTEACQVYSKSRYNSPGRWRQAVMDTRGMVVKSNKTGQIFSTKYASTSGGSILSYSSSGHSTPSIWDTPCGNQSCWPGNSYEKSAGSSWYYKGWYKSRTGSAYGRSHPWLNNEEFSDIVNAVLYFTKTKDQSHLSQNQNCISGCDPNSWSKDELKRQVSDKGGPVTKVNSVSVDYSTGGYTKTIRVSTDRGDLVFDGGDFKEVFTLRAPGALTAKSSLFNVEKK
jgi:SpoIID/LytB domain protein